MNLVKYLPRQLQEAYKAWKRTRPLAPRDCPICDYSGLFQSFGRPPRLDARCPSCGSLERHRLFWLWYTAHDDQVRVPILHFAAEPVLERKFRAAYTTHPDGYRTADLYASADLRLDIEHLDLPAESIATVICNHVLEHVNDRKALAEMHRVLCVDGTAILSVPIAEGCAQTYENPNVTDAAMRELHFGQADHVRYYGHDFRDRLTDAGFTFDEVISQDEDVVKYGLIRGEKFFICRKARAPRKHFIV